MSQNPPLLIKRFDEIQTDQVDLVGGKGLSLARLLQTGLPIPDGFVITTDAYRTQSQNGIDNDLGAAVLAAFDALGAERVAVRSSAIAEDSADASWAGQFESYLNVTRSELIERVKDCWASATSENVKAYAQSNAIGHDQLAVAVVVQRMVASEVSGVAFSVNPITGGNEIMIEALYGLGELLVQGTVTPDAYVVDKKSGKVLKKDTQPKAVRLVYDGRRNVEEPVPPDQQDQSCLSDVQLEELARLVVKVEEYYGTPQDIEWALEGGTFYVVQSRPITTL